MFSTEQKRYIFFSGISNFILSEKIQPEKKMIIMFHLETTANTRESKILEAYPTWKMELLLLYVSFIYLCNGTFVAFLWN